MSPCFAAPPSTRISVVSVILNGHITCILLFFPFCDGAIFRHFLHLFLWRWCDCKHGCISFDASTVMCLHLSGDVLLPAWSVCARTCSMALLVWVHLCCSIFFTCFGSCIWGFHFPLPDIHICSFASYL